MEMYHIIKWEFFYA